MATEAQSALVKLVRRGYEAWNHGDVSAIMEFFDPALTWQGHSDMPEPGPYHRREDVERWMLQFRDAWEQLRADPQAFVEVGDTVVVLVRMSGRGRGSGVEVGGGLDTHVWTWRDGRIVRVRILQGEESADLAGLSEAERAVLRLRFQEGIAPSRIAERLNLSEADAEALVAAGLRRMGTLAQP